MKPSQSLLHFIKTRPITTSILVIDFVMTIILWIQSNFAMNFSINTLVKYGALNPLLVTQYHEYLRLLTVMFLHGSIIHFLMNGLALFYIGGQMELILGPKKYSLLYFVSGIGSSLLVVFFADPTSVTVGASGAIFGIMGGMLMLTFQKPRWFNERAIRSIRQLIVINLVFTFLFPGISVEGHVGGLLTGLILFYFLVPKIPYFVEKRQKELQKRQTETPYHA